MIDSNLKEEFIKVYRAYADTKDEIKELNGGLNDLIKTLSKKMEMRPTILSKTFAYMLKKRETGEDEISDIVALLSEVEESKNSDDEE